MGEYFLKNPTPGIIWINDLGYEIESNQSIRIDENDFDGFLTPDMVVALNGGLVLSTTDIGDTSGDYPTQIAIEKLTLKSAWRQKVLNFIDLPLIGNEHTDVRLVESTGVLYWWDESLAEWKQLTSTFSLTVTEYDQDPLGTNIQKIVFVEPEDDVYIDADDNIAYIGVPDSCPPLGGDLSITGTNLISGRTSQSNINYKNAAGSNIDYIIKDGTFTVKSPVDSDQADKGIIKLYFNETEIAAIDLVANFIDADLDGAQDLNNYDNQGSGDIIINGTVSLPFGYFELIKVAKYNNFKYFQSWQAQFVLTDASELRQGWNEIYMTHEDLASGTQTSNKLDLFYDSDTGADPTINVPVITENVPVIKWLSGVQFYDAGSTWNVDCAGYDLFDNVYHTSNQPIIIEGWPGLSITPISYLDANAFGVSSPPDIDEIMSIQDWQLIQAIGYMDLDARLEATPRDPYGEYVSQLSLSEDIMVYSYESSSTPLKEYFRDEDYRLPIGDYDVVPTTLTAQWDSTGNIDIYDAGNGLQVIMDKLIFPVDDFTGTLPGSNPNYAPLGLEQNKFYCRAFKDTKLSRAQGTLRISGVTKQDMLDEKIKVWVKIPSQTGWLSLNKDYNYADFTGVDEDGCWMHRDVQTNSDFTFGLDRFRTEYGGYMVVVRIEIPSDNGIEVTHMEIIDW